MLLDGLDVSIRPRNVVIYFYSQYKKFRSKLCTALLWFAKRLVLLCLFIFRNRWAVFFRLRAPQSFECVDCWWPCYLATNRCVVVFSTMNSMRMTPLRLQDDHSEDTTKRLGKKKEKLFKLSCSQQI